MGCGVPWLHILLKNEPILSYPNHRLWAVFWCVYNSFARVQAGVLVYKGRGDDYKLRKAMQSKYQLKTSHNKVLGDYLHGRIGAVSAAQLLGVSRSKLDIIVVTILKNAVAAGKVNSEELIESY